MATGSSSSLGGLAARRGSRQRTTKRRITDDEWQEHKEVIERLYLDDGKDVKGVRETMRTDFGFDAHEKAYKRKFEEWGFVKNIPKDEGIFMVKKREERRIEGKETIFRRRRRPDGPLQIVSDTKLDRISDRYSHDLANWPEEAATPANVIYGSPSLSAEETITTGLLPFEDDAPSSTSNSDWGLPTDAPDPWFDVQDQILGENTGADMAWPDWENFQF